MRGEREEREREKEREGISHLAEQGLLSLRNDPLGQRDWVRLGDERRQRREREKEREKEREREDISPS